MHHPLRLGRPFCPCSSRRGVVAAHLPSNPRAPSRPPSQARGAQRAKEHICSTPLRESLFGHILIPRGASPHYVCEPSCPCSLPSERSICAMRVGHHVQQDPHWYLRSDGSLVVKPRGHQGTSSLCTKASAGAKGSTGGSFCPCSPASMRFKGCPGPPCGAPGDSRHDLCREHLAYGVRSRGLTNQPRSHLGAPVEGPPLRVGTRPLRMHACNLWQSRGPGALKPALSRTPTACMHAPIPSGGLTGSGCTQDPNSRTPTACMHAPIAGVRGPHGTGSSPSRGPAPSMHACMHAQRYGMHWEVFIGASDGPLPTEGSEQASQPSGLGGFGQVVEHRSNP